MHSCQEDGRRTKIPWFVPHFKEFCSVSTMKSFHEIQGGITDVEPYLCLYHLVSLGDFIFSKRSSLGAYFLISIWFYYFFTDIPPQKVLFI